MHTITVNEKTYPLQEHMLKRTLLHFLREEINLTGTKNGCEIGRCGSCTVLMDNKPVRTCKIPLMKAAGKTVITIEGLSSPSGSLHPIQQAFIDKGAYQCGFCTPGMIMAAYGLLLSHPEPSRDAIRRALKGNICRCTGYQQIIDAVELAADRMKNSDR